MYFRFLLIGLLLAASPEAACAKSVAKAAPADKADGVNHDPDGPKDYNTVVLQGLNKVTGHVSKLTGPLGTVMRFGTLEIIARRCWKSAPEDRPESASLLEIRELTPGEGPKQIFMGWMFASSPGLSGLEHPVYDINVLNCEARSDPEKEPEQPVKTPPAAKAAAKK